MTSDVTGDDIYIYIYVPVLFCRFYFLRIFHPHLRHDWLLHLFPPGPNFPLHTASLLLPEPVHIHDPRIDFWLYHGRRVGRHFQIRGCPAQEGSYRRGQPLAGAKKVSFVAESR